MFEKRVILNECDPKEPVCFLIQLPDDFVGDHIGMAHDDLIEPYNKIKLELS